MSTNSFLVTVAVSDGAVSKLCVFCRVVCVVCGVLFRFFVLFRLRARDTRPRGQDRIGQDIRQSNGEQMITTGMRIVNFEIVPINHRGRRSTKQEKAKQSRASRAQAGGLINSLSLSHINTTMTTYQKGTCQIEGVGGIRHGTFCLVHHHGGSNSRRGSCCRRAGRQTADHADSTNTVGEHFSCVDVLRVARPGSQDRQQGVVLCTAA